MHLVGFLDGCLSVNRIVDCHDGCLSQADILVAVLMAFPDADI